MRISKLQCDNCGKTIPAGEDRFELVAISATAPAYKGLTGREMAAKRDYCTRTCVIAGVKSN